MRVSTRKESQKREMPGAKRQKTLAAFFKRSVVDNSQNNTKNESQQKASRTQSMPCKTGLRASRTSSSSLFASQGCFDECDPDSEIHEILHKPQVSNFKPSMRGLPVSLSRTGSTLSRTSSTLSARSPVLTPSPESADHKQPLSKGSYLPSSMALPISSSEPALFTLSQGSMPSAITIKPINNRNAKNSVRVIDLTKEQQLVVDLVVKHRTSLFYTGSAGTGKSVILKTIINKLGGLYGRDSVALTASTGLAAATIGGVTLHKWSGVGIGNRSAEDYVKRIKGQHELLAVWKYTKILIVDEISMISGMFLDKLEYIARRVRKNDLPFGGIQLVFTGDFFQLPPVQKKDDNSQPVNFCFESDMWNKCISKTILLTKVFRQQDDELIQILNAIRHGNVDTHIARRIRSLNRPVMYTDGIMPTELYSTRREVEASNARQLDRLGGPAMEFLSEDIGHPNMLPMLDSLMMVEKKIILKEDAQVMMLKNKPESDLVNGSLGKVLFFATESLVRKIHEIYGTLQLTDEITRDARLASRAISNPSILSSADYLQDINATALARHEKLMTLINYAVNIPAKSPRYPYIKWSVGRHKSHHELMLPERFVVDMPGSKTGLERVQIPIMLCWAISIHKAQGQTISRLKVDLRNIFEAGQVYVALSRAVSMDQLEVLNFNPKKIKANDKVKVFYERLETLS